MRIHFPIKKEKISSEDYLHLMKSKHRKNIKKATPIIEHVWHDDFGMVDIEYHGHVVRKIKLKNILKHI